MIEKIEKRNQALWKQIEPYGMKSYLIRSGVIRNGLILFITWAFIVPLIDNGFSYYYFQSVGYVNRLIFLAIFCSLAGLLISYIGWKDLKKKYG